MGVGLSFGWTRLMRRMVCDEDRLTDRRSWAESVCATNCLLKEAEIEPQASIASVSSQHTPTALLVDSAEPAETAAPRWSQAKRILFRFAFAYLLLYNLPFPLDYILYFTGVLPAVPEALGLRRALGRG